jgi:hypothetical protein
MAATKFGVPNARCSRWIQSTQSTIADVEGDTELNTTDSGPWSRAKAWSLPVTVSRASSQLMRCQPGSEAPLTRVRFIGCRKRSGCAVISGAALPFTHNAFPVGCDGSRPSVNVPLATVALAPQRDTHNGQNVGTSIRVDVSDMTHPPLSEWMLFAWPMALSPLGQALILRPVTKVPNSEEWARCRPPRPTLTSCRRCRCRLCSPTRSRVHTSSRERCACRARHGRASTR